MVAPSLARNERPIKTNFIMRIQFVLLPLAAGFSCALTAQVLTPQVLANGGGFDQTPQLTLEWTLGQVATQTVDMPGGLLTEGFHQPALLVVAREDALANNQQDPNITVFPNPLVAELNVRVAGETSERYTVLQLMDAGGKLITERLNVSLLNGYKLDIAHLPSGTYHLRIAGSKGEFPQSFTVIKIK